MKHESPRMKRMARSHKRKTPGMNLTSLMDVFTILVFFLLTNSATDEALEAPKVITLPSSVVESKPRETVVLMVTDEEILIEAKSVMRTEDALNRKELVIKEIEEAMLAEIGKALTVAKLENNKLTNDSEDETDVEDNSEQALPEVNILADRKIPFSMLKKIMSSCTSAGYTRISLAVIQVTSQG